MHQPHPDHTVNISKDSLMDQPLLSVIICVYNEEENIKPLNKWINDSLVGIDYEIVYVDDGSTDSTIRQIKELADEKVAGKPGRWARCAPDRCKPRQRNPKRR
jgi:cellulose synthase/poly-beta-1,6-N-acetylglucosamine synthase-like glycosyltransferase